MRDHYIIRDACFACTTPYQVLGAISIALNEHLDADLYLFGMFPGFRQVAEKLISYHCFTNVYPVDCSKIGAPGRLKGFIQMMFADKTVSFFLPDNVAYRRYYSSSRALMKTIMQHVLLKRNPQMSRGIFEDGMGTYSGSSSPLNASKKKMLAEKLLGWKLDNPENTEIMAYVPELVDLPDQLKFLEVQQMPRLNFDSQNMTMLENVFSAKREDRIQQKYIVFDTLRDQSGFLSAEQYDTLDRCYDMVANSVGRDNIVNKPHPRSTIKSDSSVQLYEHKGLPMEILYAGMPDLEERILIAYNSSAVFTPKILFNREPIVICLHRVLNDSPNSTLFEGIFKKFQGIYEHPERVIAPGNMEELRVCIEYIAAVK